MNIHHQSKKEASTYGIYTCVHGNGDINDRRASEIGANIGSASDSSRMLSQSKRDFTILEIVSGDKYLYKI